MPSMTIAAGQEVALTMLAANAAFNRRGTVLFGIVILHADGPPTANTVVWENGQVSEDIPDNYLDVIANGDVGNAGRVVKPYSQVLSAEYSATVVRTYTRQVAGAGATPAFVLMRTRDGQMIEAPVAAVTPIDPP